MHHKTFIFIYFFFKEKSVLKRHCENQLSAMSERTLMLHLLNGDHRQRALRSQRILTLTFFLQMAVNTGLNMTLPEKSSVFFFCFFFGILGCHSSDCSELLPFGCSL